MFTFPSPLFFHYASFAAQGLAFFACSLVVYLSLTESNKELAEYSRILILNCIVDYTCVFVNFANQAHFEIMDGLNIIVFEGPVKYLPQNWLFICAGAFSFMIAFNFKAIPIQFAYRWFLIKKGRRLKNTELTYLVMTSFLGACFFWCNFAACFYNTDEKYEDRSFLHKNPYIYNNQSMSPVLVIANLDSNAMLVQTIATSVCMCIIGFIIWYFAFDTYLALKNMSSKMHENTKRLQRQMNWVLIIHTGTFVFCAMEPVCIYLTMTIFKLDIYGMGTLTTLLLTHIPSINPICTLLLVSRYRSRTLQLLCFWKNANVRSETST